MLRTVSNSQQAISASSPFRCKNDNYVLGCPLSFFTSTIIVSTNIPLKNKTEARPNKQEQMEKYECQWAIRVSPLPECLQSASFRLDLSSCVSSVLPAEGSLINTPSPYKLLRCWPWPLTSVEPQEHTVLTGITEVFHVFTLSFSFYPFFTAIVGPAHY